jgi:hypothetical protein
MMSGQKAAPDVLPAIYNRDSSRGIHLKTGGFQLDAKAPCVDGFKHTGPQRLMNSDRAANNLLRELFLAGGVVEHVRRFAIRTPRQCSWFSGEIR